MSMSKKDPEYIRRQYEDVNSMSSAYAGVIRDFIVKWGNSLNDEGNMRKLRDYAFALVRDDYTEVSGFLDSMSEWKSINGTRLPGINIAIEIIGDELQDFLVERY